jgi:hypothetical protein
LIGRQEIHIGNGTDAISANFVMMATVATAVTVDQSTVLAAAACRRLGTVTQTRFTQANHHGRQRQDRRQSSYGN